MKHPLKQYCIHSMIIYVENNQFRIFEKWKPRMKNSKCNTPYIWNMFFSFSLSLTFQSKNMNDEHYMHETHTKKNQNNIMIWNKKQKNMKNYCFTFFFILKLLFSPNQNHSFTFLIHTINSLLVQYWNSLWKWFSTKKKSS